MPFPENSPEAGYSSLVDPFIGCEATQLPPPEGIAATWWCAKPAVGNTHPGASLPFGMVSACAYSGAYVTGYGSYQVSLSGGPPSRWLDRHEARGIAHFQQSGTGRIRTYYNYLLTTPLVGEGLEGLGEAFELVEETAKPGYYSGTFSESKVRFEVTCSDRAVHHRYHFAEGVRPKVAIDFSAGGLRIEEMETRPTSAGFALTDPRTCRGWVMMEGVPIHFWIRAMTPIADGGIWVNHEKLPEAKSWVLNEKAQKKKRPFGIWLEAADGEEMELRIGFSLQSCERAEAALELAQEEKFPAIVSAAASSWEEVLSKIEVSGGTNEEREVFYTSFYHATLKPADFRDENPFTKLPGPFFLDLSTLWDLYKTQLPLVMTLWPEWGRDFVQFLTEVEEREGSFPISYLMDNIPERFAKQATGLCHLILYDAFQRGIEGDWDRILNELWRTSRKGKFRDYRENQIVEPLSHSLDLATAYFCMAQLAKKLGHQVIYDKSIGHAQHWKNAYDEKSGLLKQDSTYYEGENWNYSFRFLHDMAGRIDLAGGERRFVELLDLFFGFSEPKPGETVHRFEGLNNEPDMETPYAYLYVGRHDRTARVVRRVMRHQFATGKGGLPGNDDSGGLSSWFVWSAIGIFPVAGQPLMLIGSPIFDRSVIHLEGGDFVIEAENQGIENLHIEAAWLNEEPLERSWLELKDFQAGGNLKLRMSPQSFGWASESRPPSRQT